MWKDDLFCRKAISPDVLRQSGAKQVCETQQGGPVPNAQEETSVKADASFLPLANLFPATATVLGSPRLTWVL